MSARVTRHLNVAAILLAAGNSTRFGPENKLLAPLLNKPVLRWTAEALAQSRARPILAITGAGAREIASALDGLPVRTLPSPDPLRGMGRSIAAGIASLPEHADGALILPADMPLMTAAVIDTLLASFESTDGQSIVFPVDPRGAQRNPVIWPRAAFARLATLDGPAGGKSLIARSGLATLPVPFPDETPFADIDTRAGLATAAAHLQRS